MRMISNNFLIDAYHIDLYIFYDIRQLLINAYNIDDIMISHACSIYMMGTLNLFRFLSIRIFVRLRYRFYPVGCFFTITSFANVYNWLYTNDVLVEIPLGNIQIDVFEAYPAWVITYVIVTSI